MNFPKLRFQEFNDEWSFIELSKISSDISYGMGLASKEYDGENKYIRITDIDETTNKYSNKDIVSPDGVLEDKYLVNKNDILFARTGASTGKTYLYDEKDGKLYFAGFLIRANIVNHDASFIFQQTKTNKYNKWVKIMSMRSGQPGINSQEYGSYKFSITLPEEEEKISKTLNLLDKKIELQNKKIEDLKLFKSGLSYNFFNKQITEKKTLLNNHCELFTAKSKASEINSNGCYYVVDMGTITSDGYILNNKPTFCNNDMLKKGELVMPKDDIGGGLIIGKTGYISENKKYILGDHVYLLRTKNINSLFLHYQINSRYINQQLKKKVTGSAQLGLKASNITNQEIFIYSDEMQKKISDILYLCDKKLLNEIKKLKKIIKLKKGLIQNLFV